MNIRIRELGGGDYFTTEAPKWVDIYGEGRVEWMHITPEEVTITTGNKCKVTQDGDQIDLDRPTKREEE